VFCGGLINLKFPASQWYWADWMKDPAVRSVSYAARGLWMDMLSLMHESDRRGYLQVNGKFVSAELLARMTGGSTDEVSRLLQELEDSGVFSRSDDGCIYSRRMVRDERKRALCSEAGKKGGGNPTFKGDPKGNNKGHPKGAYEDEDERVFKRPKMTISHWDGKTAPPDCLTIDDLAPEILNQLGIGLSAATRNAVTEALRLKSAQAGCTVSTAFVHICKRGMEYKQSPKFKSEFKKSWANWMIDGDYDAPESWNGNGKVHTTENGQKIDRGYVPLRKTGV
jgi:biotin operon repressor